MTKAAELAKMGEVLTNSQIGGRRNIIINGAMNVAQRSTSVTGVGDAAGYFTCDRWKIETNATAGRATMSQTADVHDGFANCLKLDCTTADTSIAASELFQIGYKLEGQDLQQLKKGTSDAESITISFYTKANAAFTFGLEVYDNDNTRQMTKLFTTTTDWVRQELTFPADTTGALDDDNNLSMFLSFWLHAGSTFAGGTLETSFASATNANRAAGIDSFFSSTDNNFFLTGVQMEVGSQATPFEHRSFGEELALCQRYHYRAGKAESAYTNFGQGWATSSTAGTIHVPLPVEMRSEPSVTINDVQVSDDVNSAIDCSAVAVNAATGGRQLAVLEFTVSSGLTQYRSYGLRGSNNTASHVSLSAEL